jgi:uncharacterized repeat protein (TIGR01451 family)
VRRFLAIAALAVLAVPTSPAQASVTIGQTQGATDGCGSSIVNVQATTSGGPSYVSPVDGVVTSWSYLAGNQTPALRLRIYQPGADQSQWTARSESAEKPPGSGAGQVGANRLNTFPESPGIPIKTNDHLGLTTNLSGGALAWGCISTGNNADVIRQKNPPDAVLGTTATFPGSNVQLKIGVSAVIEPDADGDNFGDETQDSCPNDPAVHAGPCPVDVSIVKTASSHPKVGSDLVYGLSVKNNNTTNPATDVTIVDPLPSGVRFVSATTAQGSCSGTATVTCALGTLAPGQTATAAIVVRPTSAGPLSNAASATTSAGDTDTTNNSSSVLVSVAPATPAITQFKLKPKSFAAATKGGSVAAAATTGTVVSYSLNTAATTKFSVLKPTPGIKSGKRCVKRPKHPPKGAKKCTRYVSIGSFKRAAVAGSNRFRFTGRLKGKTLKRGSYRLQAVATNVSGASQPAQAGFKVK